MADYGQMLWRYTICKVRDPDLAEEILQETYTSAIGSIRNFRGACSEKTWLFTILKHKISDHFRALNIRYKRISAVCEDQIPFCNSATVPSMVSDPRQEYETKEFFTVVQSALSELPRKMAMTFYLYELKGLTKEDICQLMNIKTVNFYVTLSRARKRIRSYLEMKWVNA
jgi:RNA polymerase sigma-70 factor (ECF subfamily)